MKNTRKFYGDTIIEIEELRRKDIDGQFKIEYYQVENSFSQEDNLKYGIEILKKSNKDDTIVERKEISDITNIEEKVNNVLDILQRNKVTPISAEDVIEDLTLMGFIGDKVK